MKDHAFCTHSSHHSHCLVKARGANVYCYSHQPTLNKVYLILYSATCQPRGIRAYVTWETLLPAINDGFCLFIHVFLPNFLFNTPRFVCCHWFLPTTSTSDKKNNPRTNARVVSSAAAAAAVLGGNNGGWFVTAKKGRRPRGTIRDLNGESGSQWSVWIYTWLPGHGSPYRHRKLKGRRDFLLKNTLGCANAFTTVFYSKTKWK